MSQPIIFRRVVKRYDGHTVIPDLSLTIHGGELFTLLGPSGCGKTTLLRMVAGFNSIEGGEIAFGDRVLNDLPAHRRNIGMVFQNYAIFPHLTVEQNVGFGLKLRRLQLDERRRRLDEILRITRIEEYRTRSPQRLSGGQQQRVALARAIVIQPDVLLMDEPLSNLDAKLRLEMRSSIRQLQRTIGITTMYVTHDQEEALAISDRIAVMNEGCIQQVGTPEEIYLRPANTFVATFIGRSNLLEGRVVRLGDAVGVRLEGGHRVPLPTLAPATADGRMVKVAVRPEDFVQLEGGGLVGVVELVTFLGRVIEYRVRLRDGQEIDWVQAVDDSTRVVAEGAEVALGIDPRKVNVYDEGGRENLTGGLERWTAREVMAHA